MKETTGMQWDGVAPDKGLTRRKLLKAAGVTAAGVAFTAPLLTTIRPRPAYAAVSTDNGITHWDFDLGQGQETPPNNLVPTATGHASVTLNTTTKLLSWVVTFSGLSGPITAAHFHAPAGLLVDAPVVLGIAGGGAPSPIVGSAIIGVTFEGQLLAGLSYINVHTSLNPSGEIRGQVA